MSGMEGSSEDAPSGTEFNVRPGDAGESGPPSKISSDSQIYNKLSS
jgi:hypothetical protein